MVVKIGLVCCALLFRRDRVNKYWSFRWDKSDWMVIGRKKRMGFWWIMA